MNDVYVLGATLPWGQVVPRPVFMLGLFFWLAWIAYWLSQMPKIPFDPQKLQINHFLFMPLGAIALLFGCCLTKESHRIWRRIAFGVVMFIATPIILGWIDGSLNLRLRTQ